MDFTTYETAFPTPSGPSDNARSFYEAAEAIECCGRETGDGLSPYESQVASLEGWIRRNGQVVIPVQDLARHEIVSCHTSEHVVRFDAERIRAVKITLPGFFGQIPCPCSSVGVGRKNATPAEYLRRMALQVHVFANDIELVGVCEKQPSRVLFEPPANSLVISQQWYEKEDAPTPEEIAEFMHTQQFRSVPKTHFGWWRADERLAVVDAKPDNFAKTSAGIVALDLQLAVFTEVEATQAGLEY